MRKIIAIGIAFIIISLGLFIIIQNNYPTFQKLYSKQINEETIVKSITIKIYDPAEPTNVKARVTINDEEIISSILKDLSEVKLKRDLNDRVRFNERDYVVEIMTTNEEANGLLVTNSLTLSMDDKYINHYEVRGKTDHLKTIKSLNDRKDIEWEYR
ncbi:hypothetical protein [Bacillus sp. PS06]|uniref:hypothetical protein n=1 Tax=Bacillus sp. PS06 TaxID=2764176 RepID=UPI00177DC247|nr:hypothetical protein [Bacillus sp. PS06]MBD8067405.1 hypothetical protein [Bacillus sp. PS06]